MSRRLDTRLCGPGPTSAGAGECVSTRYYIIPTPPSSHTDTDPDILYLRLLLPRAWVLSHTLTCCFWDHRPRPLPPGLSWWKLCVRFPSQECVHCGSWDRLYSRRHVYTCNLSWKIVWIIPGTTQMWVFSSNDQIDWNYANGTHVRDHCHILLWHQYCPWIMNKGSVARLRLFEFSNSRRFTSLKWAMAIFKVSFILSQVGLHEVSSCCRS